MRNRTLEILTQRAEDGDMWAISEISKLIPQLHLLAQQEDDRDAMCLLGLCYDYGWGIACDYCEAVNWYRKAKTSYAYFKLGICYEQGHGVEQDYEEAEMWYVRSKHPEAFCRLGCLYQDRGHSMNEIVKYYRKASNAGHAYASYRLAMCYVHGWGVSINLDEAERRLQMASHYYNSL